jgi:hypothetical protein
MRQPSRRNLGSHGQRFISWFSEQSTVFLSSTGCCERDERQCRTGSDTYLFRNCSLTEALLTYIILKYQITGSVTIELINQHPLPPPPLGHLSSRETDSPFSTPNAVRGVRGTVAQTNFTAHTYRVINLLTWFSYNATNNACKAVSLFKQGMKHQGTNRPAGVVRATAGFRRATGAMGLGPPFSNKA